MKTEESSQQYIADTLDQIKKFTKLTYLSDDELESLYATWSQETYCAGWIDSCPRMIRAFCEWATSAPLNSKNLQVHVGYRHSLELSPNAVANAVIQAVLNSRVGHGAHVSVTAESDTCFFDTIEEKETSIYGENGCIMSYAYITPYANK